MLLKVQDIRASKYKIDKYVLEPLYLPAKGNDNKQIIACICQKLHIVDNLRINLLIENNILGAEGIKINISSKKAYVPKYKAIVSITIWQKNWFIK